MNILHIEKRSTILYIYCPLGKEVQSCANLVRILHIGERLRGGGGGVTSTHNKRGCAILTKKVAPKNPETYLKLSPKNPGTQNARFSIYMRKLTTQIRMSLILTPHFSFTYFTKGFYYLTFVL